MSVKVVKPAVYLLDAPTKNLCAKAARFCTEGSDIPTIMGEEKNDEAILGRVIDYGHQAVLEFADYTFGIDNVSRALTHQLVRKRIASYAQESMRYASQAGDYKIIVPESVKGKVVIVSIPGHGFPEPFTLEDLADMAHQFYEGLQEQGVPNEDARFALLEASRTKIMVKMNAHALYDFFKVRCCTCAQWEIQHIANEMLRLCQAHDPILFKSAGPKCLYDKFCREPKTKWEKCKRVIHMKG